MKKILMVIFSVTLSFGLVFSDISLVFAQEEEFTLEEITVTAQKREENQQKVGIAMEVLTGEELKEMGRADLDQILSELGSAHITPSAEGYRISIRGVGFDTPAGYGGGAAASPGSTALHVDGVFSMSRSRTTGFFDMNRVEVLMGPQSTMYAANAPGGIVNIETARPKLDTYELSGLLEYGNFNLLHSEMVLNAPITQTLAMRAATNYSKRDGYLSNGAWDEDAKAARLRFLFKPNETFSFLITGEYDTSTDRGQGGVPPFKDQSEKADPWWTPTVLTGLPSTLTQEKFTAHIDVDLGFGVMTIIPSKTDDTVYSRSTSLLADGRTQYGENEGYNFEKGLEVRMISPAESRIVWVTAFNWFKAGRLREMMNAYEPTMTTLSGKTDYTYSQKQRALLGNLTVPLTDDFRAVFGARFSKDRIISRAKVILGGGRSTLSDMDHSAPDFRIGMEYDLWDEGMFYANYASSYRVDAEGMGWRGIAYDPERVKAYTAGLKSRFFENKLQVNASAYYYDDKNRMHQNMERAYWLASTTPNVPVIGIGEVYYDMATQYIPVYLDYKTGIYYDRPGGNVIDKSLVATQTDQGGRTPADLTIKGVDVEISAIISSKDKLDLSISYLDAWVDKCVFDQYWKNQYNYPGWNDFSNRRPTFSPEWTIVLNYSHNFYLPNEGILTARFDTRFQSKQLVEWKGVTMGFDYSGYRDQEAHHIDNFNLVYAHPDGKWTISGYVKNIWNYAAKRWMAMSTTMQIGQPRTFGGIVSMKY